MNQQVEERVEIIENFIFETGKGESRKWVHYFNGYITTPFVIGLFLIVEVTSFSTLFHQYSNWAKADMMVFFSLFLIIQFPVHFISFFLYKHIPKIQGKEIEFDNNLNGEMKSLLEINSNRYKPYWLKIPVLILMIVGLFKKTVFVFTDQPIQIIDTIWNYLPLPIFLAGILLFWHTNREILKVRKNIKTVEASI